MCLHAAFICAQPRAPEPTARGTFQTKPPRTCTSNTRTQPTDGTRSLMTSEGRGHTCSRSVRTSMTLMTLMTLMSVLVAGHKEAAGSSHSHRVWTETSSKGVQQTSVRGRVNKATGRVAAPVWSLNIARVTCVPRVYVTNSALVRHQSVHTKSEADVTHPVHDKHILFMINTSCS